MLSVRGEPDSPAGVETAEPAELEESGCERGRERAQDLFTAARVVPEYEALYRRVIGR